MIRYILLNLSLIFLFVACTNSTDTIEPTDNDSTALVVEDDYTAGDTTFVSVQIEEVQNKIEIEKKFGEQWDFCDCVRKNDSIQRVIEKAPDNANFDKIFARMEEIDSKCVALLTAPTRTPEERSKHQARIKKCLKGK
jgi:hypothetical protein